MSLTRRRQAGVAVWVVGVLVALGWSINREATVETRGIALSRAIDVSPTETGKLATLDVHLHSPVSVGLVVAQMDPTPLEQERELVSAELLALQEEVAMDMATSARRFAEGYEGTQIEQARARAALAEDKALRTSLQEQLKLAQGLLAQNAGASRSVDEIQWQLNVVQARITANSELLKVTRSASIAAQARQNDNTRTEEWRVLAAARLLEQVDGRIDGLKLASALDGEVTWIYRHAGEVVVAGDPILRISEVNTREVVAWLNPAQVPMVQPGEDAEVVRATGQRLMGHVESVGAGVVQLPLSLLTNPAVLEWAVPVRILIDGEAGLGPDETVIVRI